MYYFCELRRQYISTIGHCLLCHCTLGCMVTNWTDKIVSRATCVVTEICQTQLTVMCTNHDECRLISIRCRKECVESKIHHVVQDLFDLILYVPVNNLSVTSERVFPGWTSTKLGLMCLAQGNNTVTPVRLEPAALRSRVKHSTAEPLRSLCCSRGMSIFSYWLRTLGPTDALTHVSVYKMSWFFKCLT